MSLKVRLAAVRKILGEITQEIYSIAENFTLTDEERREKFQQLEDNQIRLVQEQERLEERELELFGLRLPKDQMQQDIDNATSFWLTSGSIQRLVMLYLRQQLKIDQEFILGERHLKTLRLSGRHETSYCAISSNSPENGTLSIENGKNG